ncbi:MAG: AI-2E family transporter, partial [Candidatus Porifericomitaceae bacterium WSBS_2022_MAG_OTU9]
MGMWAFLNKHYQRYFYEPQSILLLLLVLSGVLVVWLLGNLLLPFLLAVIVAYVLEGFVQYVASGQSGRKLVVVLVFLLFMALSALFALVVVPVVLSQTSELLRELPYMLATALDYVKGMPQRYPDIFSEEQVGEFIGTFRSSSLQLLQNSALDISLASVSFLVVSVVYIVIVPFTVFFLLYDKGNIVAWVQGFLPRNRLLLQQVWLDMDRHLSNYLRGKFYEIMILGITSYVLFIYYDLNYASLMA